MAVGQDWIYPLVEGAGFGFGRDGQLAISPKNFHQYEIKTRSEWGLSTGFRLVSPGDRVWAYFGGAVREIHGVGVVDSISFNKEWDRPSIFIHWNKGLTAQLRRSPIRYDEYRQHVQSAMPRANKATAVVLRRWLARGPRQDVRELEDVSFVRREVMQRTGQGQFRLQLLNAYQGRCAISGCAVAEVLEAAHIVPVGLAGTHSVSNGLLLRSDLHTLFDLGLIWIAGGRVQVDDSLVDLQYRRYKGSKLAAPSRRADRPTASKFAEHRRRFSR